MHRIATTLTLAAILTGCSAKYHHYRIPEQQGLVVDVNGADGTARITGISRVSSSRPLTVNYKGNGSMSLGFRPDQTTYVTPCVEGKQIVMTFRYETHGKTLSVHLPKDQYLPDCSALE